ncbi:FRG domain-containing protein [Acidiphilium sp. PM]|uniref:FRG domain-containing protein n=1 Tax=Acidiphilium sp. PM TaxID=1043206 RepID=UPI0002144CF1|nr:FRG domain-containing protein [Acidiphilium sp. PM]EGO93556.1 hypothetical protein APM_3748 [Acidiphilium sp. PM]
MTWKTHTLATEGEVFELLMRWRGDKWYSRGQSKCYNCLIPSIDRDAMNGKSRPEKINLERRSIDIFRASARFFSHPGEIIALTDDLIALAILRHHGVRTRLLDWSRSPFVAAYFAVCCDDDEDGEIWGFDESEYMKKGVSQWSNPAEWKYEFEKAAFYPGKGLDFFVCMTYPTGFGRQNAQDGLYSLTSIFDRDHAERIEQLLNKPESHARYLIPKTLKATIRDRLRLEHGIWDVSLYPDSAGAAKTAGAVFP